MPDQGCFFTVPTAGLRVLVVLAHHRRRVVHFNVTAHPTAYWTAQQIVDAFPDDSAPAYPLRDRDAVYAKQFRRRVKGMGIEEVVTAPRSPWHHVPPERFLAELSAGSEAVVRLAARQSLHRESMRNEFLDEVWVNERG